ncbi:FAD-dependent oxidoreductase [Ostreibacterium oceani]|uniref:FAD-dependent oxidoreductase n=1 Tax=Ostreibacterium oceani TaxID=2654998 RepID=A0A6N7EYH6_9GAMM|nr:FAD-dependent oxidoreductase [Ostreibacterium oceani]MPV86187.1 FAD-dependent oxidoreductase [Ostreibacterium oceani]
MTEQSTPMTIDALIVGGGIAGLWTLAKLTNAGYRALLVEKSALGSGQTIHSQGIIHGGTKYALLGKMTNAQRQIAGMPDYWRDCLAGNGEMDLGDVTCHTQAQTLWALPQLSSRVTGFFASHLMKSHVTKIPTADRPPVLQHHQCQGNFYALNEPVLDVKSLLMCFANRYRHHIITDAKWQLAHPQADNACDSTFDNNCASDNDGDGNGDYKIVSIKTANTTLTVKAAHIIYTAGKANASLSNDTANQQIRPLRMVYAHVPKTFGQLYLHVLAASDKPRLTITTHPYDEQTNIWYLGGHVAETGAHLSDSETITLAKKELTAIFPWLDFSQCPFASFVVDRAEGSHAGNRPDTPVVHSDSQTIVAWPTKLAMAPMLADAIVAMVARLSPTNPPQTNTAHTAPPTFATPRIANYPWECN